MNPAMNNAFADLLSAQFPSQHTDADQPPAVADAALGQQVPAGPLCPQCGAPARAWFYNPHSRRQRDGWVLLKDLPCRCPEKDPMPPPAAPRPAECVSQAWLDAQFQQRAVRAQTFVTFHLETQPRLREIYEAVRLYAQKFTAGTPRGLFLAGAAHTGKGHLAAALVNAARGSGFTAIALSQARLLDLVMPEPGETLEHQEDRRRRRKALRVVEVLAIRDLLRALLLPSQLAELDLLLEYRAERGLVTHFTAAETPARLRARTGVGRPPEGTLTLLRRIESLTEPLTIPPSAAPYTVQQRRRESPG